MRLAIATASALLAGCSTVKSLNPFDDSPALKPLATASSSVAVAKWQVSAGAVAPGMRPAVHNGIVYSASIDGTVLATNLATGAQVSRTQTGTRLSAGVGTDGGVLVVGTDKGEVLGLDLTGQKRWTGKVSSSVISPPHIADGVVVVVSGDGAISGLDVQDGRTKWTIARTLPALTVRNHAGAVSTRRAGLLGTAGGRLLGFDTVTGALGWESVVANPRGATELDRIADVTSLVQFDDRVACVTSYQGRTGCFDLVRGTTVWVRDIASRFGLVMDADHAYVVDDKFVLHALDKSTGATVWKQDALAGRRVGSLGLVGNALVTFDAEGVLHALDAKKGTVLGRSLADLGLPVQTPIMAENTLIWQTAKGALVSYSIR